MLASVRRAASLLTRFWPDCNKFPASLIAGCSSTSASKQTHREELQDVIIIPMPKLSPNMTHGSVSAFNKSAGEEISNYDVVLEVDTDSLTEQGYKTGDFEGTVTLLVESQEEGFFGKGLVEHGVKVPVGTPVALMCEQQESVAALENYQCTVSNVYEGEGHRTLIWQSYLKERKSGNGGNTCMS